MTSILTFSIKHQSNICLLVIQFTKICYHVTMRKDLVRNFLIQKYQN